MGKKIEKLTDVLPQRANANRHTARGMGALEASIQADGWIGAITVAADGETFDGSARLETGAGVGFGDVEPIIIRSKGDRPIIHIRDDIPTATDPRAVRLGIAANRVASLNLDWQPDVLAGIAESGVDLGALFTADEWRDVSLPSLPEAGGGGDEFDTTPEDGPTRTKLGELWSIGHVHRLLVGDCTDAANVARLMGGELAALVATSPPYWVGKEYEQEHGQEEIKAHIERAAMVIASAIGDRPHIAINTGTTTETHQGGDVRRIYLLLDWWSDSFAEHGIYLRNLRIWAKHGNFIPYSPAQDVVDLNWEFLASFTKALPRGQNKIGDRWALDGMWDCQPQTANVDHDAPYPLEIPSRYMLLYTDKNELVYEPYCGSGTTLIAAHRTGRRCYGMEIAPRYADVILRRAEAEGLACERIQQDA